MDAETIAKGLSATERAWVIAMHGDVVDDAGMIAWRAKRGRGGSFAYFARNARDIIVRSRSYDGAKFLYSLTPLGLDVREILLRDQ